jgi:hypothetical protein
VLAASATATESGGGGGGAAGLSGREQRQEEIFAREQAFWLDIARHRRAERVRCTAYARHTAFEFSRLLLVGVGVGAVIFCDISVLLLASTMQ